MKKRKISQALLNLLGSGRWNDFTVSELKTAYMALPNCLHRRDKAAWQFVYRNVLRMESCGLVSCLAGEESSKSRYQWRGSAVQTDSGSPTALQLPDDPTVSCLKEKLHRYKVEMLSAIGETEEYDAICSELPHMRKVVQVLYNEARDRCSKTLGRVKALESILANQLSLQQS